MKITEIGNSNGIITKKEIEVFNKTYDTFTFDGLNFEIKKPKNHFQNKNLFIVHKEIIIHETNNENTKEVINDFLLLLEKNNLKKRDILNFVESGNNNNKK